jgi:hypothetical protein
MYEEKIEKALHAPALPGRVLSRRYCESIDFEKISQRECKPAAKRIAEFTRFALAFEQ